MRAEHVAGSTRGPALPYPAGMRTSTILFSFLFTLAVGVACKDDAPKGAEFGEPCGGDDGTPCADGLECYIGYCEENCGDKNDCQDVQGSQRECYGGLCHIVCDAATPCPQTLETPLECGMQWCHAAGGL